MERTGSGLFFFYLAVCCCFCYCFCPGAAQAPIPARYDGFVYEVGAPLREGSVVVEAFFDPLCPDSRDAWPPLRRVLHDYSPRVFLVVHPFPLPYHDNSFFSCRALHIANKLNKSTTYPLLELFFKYQEKLYNWPTHKMSRESVIQQIVNLAVKATGNSSLSALENGFEDSKTDKAARISFKYGCSRGVVGTPFFFVNGFPLPDAGSPLDYSQWRRIIDPLVSDHSMGVYGTLPAYQQDHGRSGLPTAGVGWSTEQRVQHTPHGLPSIFEKQVPVANCNSNSTQEFFRQIFSGVSLSAT